MPEPLKRPSLQVLPPPYTVEDFQRLREKDSETWNRVANEFYIPIRNSIAAVTKHSGIPMPPEAIATITFVKAIRASHTLRDIDKLLPWLRTIAWNEVYRAISKNKHDLELVVPEADILAHSDNDDDGEGFIVAMADPSELNDIPEQANLSFLSEKVEEALEQMFVRGEQRAACIVRMFYFFNLSAKEIASLLGVSVQTVQREHRNAHRALYHLLKKYL